jgi:peroxiredoxin
MQQHADYLHVKILRMGEEITVPDPPRNPDSTLVDSSWSYQYYINHYWDNCDFSDPALLRTPHGLDAKITYYFDNVIIPIPDTINKYADLLIDKTKHTPELFRYVIWYITQKYERSQYVGHDAVFVHMIKTYYEKGLCPWVDEEHLKVMVNEGNRLDKILIGRVAPHLYMPDTAGNLRSNYEFDKKYTIMWFWDINCGICKTATPILKEFYDRAKDSLDFEVYAICLTTDSVKWKQAIIEKGLTWVNVGMNRANIDFKEVYGATTTPVVFIIDKEKKIIAKKIEAKEIENVLRNHEEGKRIR